MRGAFVVQLGPETRPTDGQFEGWVEEVDSCTVLRFRSSDELLKFLGQRFDLVLGSANKDAQVTKVSKSHVGRRSLLQGRASKAEEVAGEIRNRRRMQQMEAAHCLGTRLRLHLLQSSATEGYHYFHCRFRGSDCWEAYLTAHRYRTGAR
jgi:hypothetical protein